MPRHVIVDGSNLATEGRSMPSLAQLEAAVKSFMDDNPDDVITIVVDATFGHRIDSSEVASFEAGIEHNELVAPPAGAIGRGDAFVLAIASKVGGTILSNDSFQEFHGVYDWLFDDGRLIGGKPVPNVGWVFVPRLPVRGPTSRKSVREASQKNPRTPRGSARVSKVASGPLPVPKLPPPGPAKQASAPAVPQVVDAALAPGVTAHKRPAPEPEPAADTEQVDTAVEATADRSGGVRAKLDPTNDLASFLGFVEKHPIGSSVNAVVDTYSSHGAYVKIGDVVAYLPLRLMASPPPRSARDIVKIGDAITLAVSAYQAQRRSIELCVPALAPAVVVPPADSGPKAKPRKRAGAKSATAEATPGIAPDATAAPAPPIETPALPLDPTLTSPAARARRSGRRPAPAPTVTTTPTALPADKGADQAILTVEESLEPVQPEPSVVPDASPPAGRPTKRGGRKAVAVPAPQPEPVVPTAVPVRSVEAPARRSRKNAFTKPAPTGPTTTEAPAPPPESSPSPVPADEVEQPTPVRRPARKRATKPVTQSSAVEPADAQPVAAEPVAAEPVAAEPVAAEPVAAEPATIESGGAEVIPASRADQPGADQRAKRPRKRTGSGDGPAHSPLPDVQAPDGPPSAAPRRTRKRAAG